MNSLEPTAQSVWQRQPTQSIEFVPNAVSSGEFPRWVGYLIIIGHSFCRGCIGDWIKPEGDRWCPLCKSKLSKDPTKFCSFETVQRGVVRQMSLGC